ncbi:MAG: sulfotransferase, partial [Acidobacteriota bacterium]
MSANLLPFVRDLARFVARAAARPRRGRWLRQDLALLVFLLIFVPLQCVHWLGFLLDELFYRGYRRVRIERPLFILGLPRSGTTHLHRTL